VVLDLRLALVTTVGCEERLRFVRVAQIDSKFAPNSSNLGVGRQDSTG
jgi:hypothetical protein